MYLLRLAGKVAIVTGGASGIGKASSILFTKEGARVVVVDMTDIAGDEVVRVIRDSEGEATYVRCDVTKDDNVRDLLSKTIEKYGRIDILYNNAGISGPTKSLPEITEIEWDRLFSTNVKGVFLCSKHAIPFMRKQGKGVIINQASNLGFISTPFWPAYCATKGAVIALTKAMAVDHAPDNIRVNCICPGTVDTPLLRSAVAPGGGFDEIATDFGRVARPEEIAYLALFLASDESSYMTGSAVVIDNGMSARGGPCWPSPLYFKV